MEEKYGGELEIVRSQFYRETGDPALRKMEIDFADAVARQSRSMIYGRWCVFGNQLFGDRIAHWFVMSMLAPKSIRPALEHIHDLQADVIVTTHWGSAYYVERMKGEKPYLIMYVPDLYSNGMFNIDCNDWLISTKEGLAEVERQRMYAGGHCGLVHYPIREEASSRSKASAARSARSWAYPKTGLSSCFRTAATAWPSWKRRCASSSAARKR